MSILYMIKVNSRSAESWTSHVKTHVQHNIKNTWQLPAAQELLCQAGQFIRSDAKGMVPQSRVDKGIMRADDTVLPGYKLHALAYNVQSLNLSPYAVHKQDISTCPVFALCLGSSAQPHHSVQLISRIDR